MRIGMFLAYWPWFSFEEQVKLSRLGDEVRLDSVWISEAWGHDAVSVLGYLAAKTERIALGSALMQIPARQPTATAMAAAGLDVVSGGRVVDVEERRQPADRESKLAGPRADVLGHMGGEPPNPREDALRAVRQPDRTDPGVRGDRAGRPQA